MDIRHLLRENLLSRRTLFGIVLILAAISTWYFRYQRLKIPPPAKTTPVKITAQLLEEPYFKGQSQYFKLKGIRIRSRRYPKYSYGDFLVVSGTLDKSLLVSFPQIKKIEAEPGVYQGFVKPLLSLRRKMEGVITGYLPEPQASLLSGILLGLKRSLPEDFYENLRKTGTMHVVVISGSNVSLIANIVGKGTLFLGKNLSFGLSLLFIILFALFVGGGAPVIRASLMGIITLLGLRLGRPRSAISILLFSALVMLLIDPLVIGDLGFQLSFLSTFGILSITPILKSLIPDRFAKLPFDNLLTTLASQIMVMPILMVQFGELSLISPLVNFLILLVVPYITYLGIALLVSYRLIRLLSRLLSVIIYIPLSYFVLVVNTCAKFSFAAVKVANFSIFLAVLYYYFLFVCLYFFRKRLSPQTSGQKISRS